MMKDELTHRGWIIYPNTESDHEGLPWCFDDPTDDQVAGKTTSKEQCIEEIDAIEDHRALLRAQALEADAARGADPDNGDAI